MNKTNMNEDYNSLKNFWNEMFKTMEVGKIEGKWITDETFNNNAIKCLEKANKVLDYGCGSGWGLIELSHTKKFEEGLGIDTSETAVDFANKTCEVSGINNLKFIAGDQTILKDYKEYFDFILTVNTLDVLPDDITEDILQTLKDSLKANGKIMICLNPDFSEDDLVNLLKMEKKGKYYYKNGILRCNKRNEQEWKDLFLKYFKKVESYHFSLTESEKKYPRMMFICE